MHWYLYLLLVVAVWNWVSLLGEKARLRAKARRLESDMVAARVAHQKSQQQLEQAQQAVHDTQDAQERLATKLHDTSAQLQLVTKDFDATKAALEESKRECVQLQQTARRAEQRALASPIIAPSKTLLPSSMTSLKEELAAAQDHATALQQRVDELLVQQASLKKEHAAHEASLQQRVDELLVQQASLRKELAAREASLLSRIDELGAEAEAQRTQHKQQETSLLSRIDELGAEAEAQRTQHKQQETSLQSRIDELAAALESLRADKHQLQAAQSSAAQELADAQAQCSALEACLAAAQQAAAAAQEAHTAQLEAIEQRMAAAADRAAAAEASMRETDRQLADAQARADVLAQQAAQHTGDVVLKQRLQALAKHAAEALAQHAGGGNGQWRIPAQQGEPVANGSTSETAAIEQLEACVRAMTAMPASHPPAQEDRAALLRKLRKAQLHNQQLRGQLVTPPVAVSLSVTPAAKVAVLLQPQRSTAGASPLATTPGDLEAQHAALLLELNTLTVDRDLLAREVAQLTAKLAGAA